MLPFENLSADPDNAYFAEGMQEEILTRLAKIADLKVISRNSTQRYHSKPGNLAEIAKQLGVANIVEGSVQKAGDQVRVNVQLINAQTDSHLWADTYDQKFDQPPGHRERDRQTHCGVVAGEANRPRGASLGS